ncbi:MAG: TonB-dependent receptor [Sphingobium sp.]|nr:TonB-dependent receptor [Sphingobium sp.]
MKFIRSFGPPPTAAQRLFLTSTALGLAFFPIAAQADSPDADNSNQIIVTGTRATNRTVANSASPIDVIDAKALAGTGQINLLESLNTALPSFNLPARVQPDLGSLVRAGQLRNLDPAYTLVLVNGKRRHTTAVVNEDGFPGSVAADLSLIPSGSIGRVEVLRDGASALYGSDAIAGVINIILNQEAGFSASGQYGQTYERDGKNGYLRLGAGVKLGDRGFIRVDGEYQKQGLAVRNFALQPDYLSYPAIRNNDGQPVRLGSNNSLPAGASPNPKEATRNPNPWKNLGVPRTETWSASLNASYELSDAVTLYGFGTYAHRTGASPQNFRLPNTIFTSNPGLLNVYPDGFTPYETIKENDFSLTGGLKGQISGWNWDLSASYGRDDIDVGVENSANYSLTYPGAQTDFYIGNRNYSRFTSNFDISRLIEGPFAEPAELSFGVEYSREDQELNPGEPNSYYGGGSSALVGYNPIDASDTHRHSKAAYASFSFRPVAKLLLDLAGRYEDYSDFGSNWSGRLSARYDFTPTFALRGTVSNGFHAPALITQSYSNTSDHAGVPYTLAQPTSATARALGATALKAEKAINYTIGLTFNPTSSVRFAVDAYQIEIDNRLGVSSNIGIDYTPGYAVDGSGRTLTAVQEAQVRQLLTNAGLTIGQGVVAHYFTNVGDTRTRGIDVTLDGVTNAGNGRIRWGIAANVNRTKITNVAEVPAALQGLPNINTLTASAQYALRYRAPTDKQILSLGYDNGPWSLNLRQIRYGKLIRLNTLNNERYSIKASYTTDASIDYRFTEKSSITLGVNNLFNAKPHQLPLEARSASSRAQYTGAYDNSGPLGVLGGYYYARFNVNF